MPVARESITQTLFEILLTRVTQVTLHPEAWIRTPFKDMQLSQTNVDEIINRMERCYNVEYHGDIFGTSSTPDDVIGVFYQLINNAKRDLGDDR
jgi:hypothetical protein